MALLSALLGRVIERARAGDAAAWEEADAALGAARAAEPEVAEAVDARNTDALAAIVEAWTSGRRNLPVQDREVLRRAMTAFRKSLKVTRLNDESGLTRNPMTDGRRSGIQGVTPPPRYPPEVWRELARQRRLIDAKHGIYELPPE